MRTIVSLVLLAATSGCVQPTAVFYKDLQKPRVTRVNLRSVNNELRSSNVLDNPVDLGVGSPAVVTMFSDLQIRVTIHGASYTMVPASASSFNTDDASIASILEKYFVDADQPLDVEALGPVQLVADVKSGRPVIGMTKAQVYAALGPPEKVGSAKNVTVNMPLSQIMESNEWHYVQTYIVFPFMMTCKFQGDKLSGVVR